MAEHFYATPEEIARVDAALTKTQGNRKHAAIALGLDPKKVYDMVCDNGPLAAKWGKKHPDAVEPGPDTDIHREPGLRPMEEKVAVAITKQDAELHKGWQRLGFDNKERKFLAQLQGTYARSYSATLDLAYGGCAHANTRLLLVLENLTEKVADIEAHPEKYQLKAYTKDGSPYVCKSSTDYLREFHGLIVQVSAELRKMGDSAMAANVLRLKIERMRREQAKPDEAKKVAGWDGTTPIEVTNG